MRKNNKHNVLIMILIGIVLIAIIAVSAIYFQNSRKNKLFNEYIEKCSGNFIDGKQHCECGAYHIKYILGEKEAYKYFDMYITHSPELDAYVNTKIDRDKMAEYCKDKESLTDVFMMSTDNASKKLGISANKAFCISYNTLNVLGKGRYMEFLRTVLPMLSKMTSQEYNQLNSLYELDKIFSKWQTCSDKFSINDIKTDNQDVKEVIEKLRAYYSEKSEQQDENRIQQINFDN